MIRAVLGQILLAPSTEEFVFELAILAPELFNFGFELSLAIDRPRMHRLPIPDLFAEIEVVAPQADDFLAKRENFTTKLAHQIGQISQLGG